MVGAVSFEELGKKRMEISQTINELNNEVENLKRQLTDVRNCRTLNLGALALLNDLLPEEALPPAEVTEIAIEEESEKTL